LSQTYPEVEVIVVDDGSTDDTAQRVACFGDRITYIRKENTGRGDNRNQALIRSSGKYIQFLDADDTIDAEKLATQIPYLEADETVTCIYSDCSCNDSEGVDLENASYPLGENEDALPVLLRRTLFGIHAGITRREAIMDVGMFDPDPLAQEDWDLWLKLALKGYKYKYVPGDYAHYDQQGSSTVVNSPLMYKRMKHMLAKYLNDPDFKKLDPRLVNNFVAQQNFQLATRAYNNRWWKEARQHFVAAAKADPSVMSAQFWACIPKTYVRQIVDLAKGNRVATPEQL
jgi:glycosyltransferase involved in cell wall biosynthesis